MYTDKLQLEGARQRLNDENEFRNAMLRTIFADNEQLLRTKLRNQSIISADKRDFEKAMSTLSITDAIEIAKNELRASQRRAQIEGVGTATKGVIAAYASGDDKDKKKEKERELLPKIERMDYDKSGGPVYG